MMKLIYKLVSSVSTGVFLWLFTEIILDKTISVIVGSLTGNLGKIIIFIPGLLTVLCGLKLLKDWKASSNLIGLLLLTLSVISNLFYGSFLFLKTNKADKEFDNGLVSIFTQPDLEIKQIWLNSIKTGLDINDKYWQELISNLNLADCRDYNSILDALRLNARISEDPGFFAAFKQMFTNFFYGTGTFISNHPVIFGSLGAALLDYLVVKLLFDSESVSTYIEKLSDSVLSDLKDQLQLFKLARDSARVDLQIISLFERLHRYCN